MKKEKKFKSTWKAKKSIGTYNPSSILRLYCIVNKDMGKSIRKRGMTKSYQHVQGTHAVAQYFLENRNKACKWGNETIVVLKASNRQFWYYLKHKKYSLSYFTEPDLNNEVTAFATVLREEDFGIFKHLKLL